MTKIRICHLSTAGEADLDRICAREARSLAGAYADIVVVLPESNRSYREDNVRKVYYQGSSRLRRVLNGYYRAIRERAHVYHLHDPELLLLGWWLRLFSRGRIIYDAHQPTFHYYLWHFGHRPWTRNLRAGIIKLVEIVGVIFVDGLVVATPHSLRQLSRFNPHAVGVYNYPLVPDMLPGDGGEVIFYRGSVGPQVAVNMILEAVFQVRLEMPEVTLAITRPNSETGRRHLEEMLADLNLAEGMRYLPADADPPPASLQVGIATPNNDEYFQLAQQAEIFNYMARGIPVICGHTPFTERVVAEHEAGIVLKHLNSNTLSEAVRRIFRNPTLGWKMGQNGMRAVQNRYNWSSMEARLLRFYRAVLR